MTLLQDDDLPPFEYIAGRDDVPLLLVCEHAGNNIPKKLGNLGLSEENLNDHIAFDIGAGELTRALAKSLGAHAVLANYSRLVIDCNREIGHPTQILAVSDGVAIPANKNLGRQEIAQRIDEIFNPFHAKVIEVLREMDSRFARPVTAWAIHSFTPQLRSDPQPRPWHIGILWKDSEPEVRRLMRYLEENTNLTIGDNQPYSAKTDPTYTLTNCALGIRDNMLLEFRNNEIRTPSEIEKYAAILRGYWMQRKDDNI